MPYLETPEELADTIATWLGFYGSHTDDEVDCPKDCRICFTVSVTQRIRDAVTNEAHLATPKGGL